MTAWIGVTQRVVQDVAIAVERLRITRPCAYLGLLSILIAQLEPEALRLREGILFRESGAERRLVKVYRQRAQRGVVVLSQRRGHAAFPRGHARHDAVRAGEAPERGIVVARAVEEQPGVVLHLPGEVARRLGDVAAARAQLAPRRERLAAQDGPAATRRGRDAAEVVAAQIDRGVRSRARAVLALGDGATPTPQRDYPPCWRRCFAIVITSGSTCVATSIGCAAEGI